MGDPSSSAAAAEAGEAAVTGEPSNVASEQVPAMKPPPQMLRPGLGKAGRSIEVLCNHFMVNYAGSQDVCHYDVSISDGGSAPGGNDGIANKNLCRSIIGKLQQVYGAKELGGKRFAYDGEKSLFTPGAFNFQTQEFTVLLEESAINKANSADEDSSKRRKMSSRNTREFKVKIEYAATVKMGAINAILSGQKNDRAQDALRVLDIVLKQHAASKGYLLIKDNHFSPLFGVADIGEGVQTCRGYHVSFRPSLRGLSLNLDVATTTVIKPSSVLDFIKDRFQPPNPNSIDWDKVKRVLKGIKVETPHTQMVYRIIGFSDAPCSQQKFMKKTKDESGQIVETELTIEHYYEIQYNISLRFPNLPCIAAGRTKRPIYVPVELCNIIPGQRYTKALSSSQRQKMIDQARQGPDERRDVVQRAMDVSDYSSNELVKDFNIKIDSKMRKIPARLLDAPTLMFGEARPETPRNGRWNLNNKSLQSAVKINSWAVISFDGRMHYNAVEKIAQDLAKVCSAKGMSIPRPEPILSEQRNNQRLPAAERVNLMIQDLKSQLQSPPAFMLCILPERKTSDLYGPLKKMLQTKLSIVTQCVAPPRQVKDQYLTNVALKINAKVGGYNSLLALEVNSKLPKISSVPTIIFGMDVSHGPPGYSDSPSIAAVVASREWPYFSKYGVRMRAQSRKVEMIAGLYEDTPNGGIIVELLKDFYNSCQPVPGITDRRPMQVIIFRDGVSESQFEQVLREEYLAFKRAFKKADTSGSYEPRITLIVVQKRHHTRFFPATGGGNVSPGTIVDAAFCHPRDYDFYLCAHAGLIGTTRPTHYHVLVDENNFSVDDLQQITHALCYTYARSTTAVSTVAPVAYAHLAATHARNFLDSEGSETSSMTGRSERSTPIHLPELHPAMRTKMFYC